ncbi:hypothetical protein [Arthrobacter sp. LFS091]|uniref:hypothetical protein n=1 Tax=Arthrobacter sp. LFS091 TaxID=3229892 RepID=UPI003A80CAE8
MPSEGGEAHTPPPSEGESQPEIEVEEFAEGQNFPLPSELPPEGKKRGKKTRKDLVPVRNAEDVKHAKERAKLDRLIAETNSASEERNTTIGLRKNYGIAFLGILVLQLLIVDYIFFRFLEGRNFEVSDTVMVTFLTSVVVEVIGLVAIVANSLFKAPPDEPKGGKGKKQKEDG